MPRHRKRGALSAEIRPKPANDTTDTGPRTTTRQTGSKLPRSLALLTEADTAHDCDELARKLGWRVENYEQRRRTMIHEGLPDRRYVAGNGFRVWVELKRPGGKMTAAQHAWILAELGADSLALPVDDVAQLRELYTRWGKIYGKGAALDYCRDVTTLVAMRGYREGKAA